MRKGQIRSIAIAEPRHIIREGLVLLLKHKYSIDVIGEAADGWGTIELVGRTRPEVLITDPEMPDVAGADLVRRVARVSPETKILVMSNQTSQAYAKELLKNGASLFIHDFCTLEEFEEALTDLQARKTREPMMFHEEALKAYRETRGYVDLFSRLTSRELEVVSLVAEGRTNQEIARQLAISPRTAETHRANIMRKLGLRSHAELIRLGLRIQTGT